MITSQRCVEATAAHARSCKVSARTKGYHGGSDSGESIMHKEGDARVGKTTRFQPPLLNRLYFYREVVIRAAVHKALALSPTFEGPRDVRQILVLGAGLDRCEYSPNSNNGDYAIHTFEVDFPSVIDDRRRIHQASDGSSVGAGAARTTLIPLDLAGDNAVKEILRHGLQPSVHTVVITESVLSYMRPDRVDVLMRDLTAAMASVCLVSYDPILPRGARGFAAQTQLCFASNHTPLLSAATSQSELAAHSALIWRHVKTLSVQQALARLIPHAPSIPLSLEPFDEFASMAILNKQYVLLLSSHPHHVDWW
jgi:hypothetical protein